MSGTYQRATRLKRKSVVSPVRVGHAQSRHSQRDSLKQDSENQEEITLTLLILRPDTEVPELPGIGHATALMSYDQISAVREFLLR